MAKESPTFRDLVDNQELRQTYCKDTRDRVLPVLRSTVDGAVATYMHICCSAEQQKAFKRMTRTLAKYLISVVWDSEITQVTVWNQTERTLETVKITTLQYDGRIILCRRMFAALFYEVITAMLRPDPMGVARRLAAAWRNPVEFFTTLQLAASPSREPEVIDITGDAGSDDDVMEIIELSPPRPMPLSRMIRSSRAVARRTMTLRPRKVVNIP